jgi:hypothetical protein
MSGSNASPLTPLAVGTSDSGDFSSWYGRPIQIGDETYIVVECGAAIAASSQGKQLVTAISSGQATWVVSLATGIADPMLCGAIPSTLTAAIASGAAFLALRDSAKHQLLVLGSTTGSATVTGGAYVGALLKSGSGSTLIDVFTGTATSASVTGTTLDIHYAVNNAGYALAIQTGTAATQTWVRYRAPFRGAN